MVGLLKSTSLFQPSLLSFLVGLLVTLYYFQFLQLYHKVRQIKVAWYVLRVKNMHFGPPSEFQKPSQTATEQGEAELRILTFKST